MSPEQALGQRVDVRTDIFSFGSLLYEALTGSRAFAGDSTASILAAILRDSPVPIETRRPGIPSDLARILRRCLEKDREERYPEGRDDFPVGGVSWYEAAAYAEFAGKSLPTIYHWRRANTDRNFEIVSLSNFGGNPARVGSYQELSPYGNYDMAGNVKEWCWNETDGLRYLLGAAWNELNYQFMEPDAGQPCSSSGGLRTNHMCPKRTPSISRPVFTPRC